MEPNRRDDEREKTWEELVWDAELLAAPPLVARPTVDGVTLSLVAGRKPVLVALELAGEEREPLELELDAGEVRGLRVEGLAAGAEYEYELVVRAGEEEERHAGRFVTQRPRSRGSKGSEGSDGEGFRFAVFSDPHLPVPHPVWLTSDRYSVELAGFLRFHAEVGGVMRETMASIRSERPDLILCLGDMLHLSYGFNGVFPTDQTAGSAYLDFRRHLGPAASEAAFFSVVGNWEGENGWHSEAARARARKARTHLLPNPTPSTYPQGGGDHQDYFAFSWGDALFVVLNVMGYTEQHLTLDPRVPGSPEDWTLGREQSAWLEETLRSSREPVKMLFIHHAVGGRGADERNSIYGRGGGRAARVGEQARVHELMREHGVQIFFYGHDHVFTDMVVDGIHYTLPGSAGAPWKFADDETGYEEYDPRSGFALVTVSPQGIVVEFRDEAGRKFRSFRCEVGG